LTGRGASGEWLTVKDGTAPSKPNALSQTRMDETNYRFPVCVYEGVVTADADISVRFKPVKGRVDQAAGIVWRYQDKDNYYVVRANALENNVVLYKVHNGKRADIDPVGSGLFTYGRKTNIPSGEWGSLRVKAQGSRFVVYINAKQLFEVEDSTFQKAGRIGLWTKADSYTLFDDLEITILSKAQGLIDRLILEHQNIVRLTIHAVPTGEKQSRIIACNLRKKIGQPSDPEDLAAIKTNRTTILHEGGNLDVTAPIRNRLGTAIAATGITLKMGDNESENAVKNEAVKIAAKINTAIQESTKPLW
jgi:hypothetical protein